MQVDAEFAGSEALQPLPRLVYALLRSPLLTERRPGQHPDLRTAVCHLWAGLPHQELRSAVYPLLSSFSNPDTMASTMHLFFCSTCCSPVLGDVFGLLGSFGGNTCGLWHQQAEQTELGAHEN